MCRDIDISPPACGRKCLGHSEPGGHELRVTCISAPSACVETWLHIWRNAILQRVLDVVASSRSLDPPFDRKLTESALTCAVANVLSRQVGDCEADGAVLRGRVGRRDRGREMRRDALRLD